jgi:hypothetical protein
MSKLDEAYLQNVPPNTGTIKHSDAFKAGARWMAKQVEQGISWENSDAFGDNTNMAVLDPCVCALLEEVLVDGDDKPHKGDSTTTTK